MNLLQFLPFYLSEREPTKMIIKHETRDLVTLKICLETLQELSDQDVYRSTAQTWGAPTPIHTRLGSFQGSVFTIHVTGTTYTTSLYFVSTSVKIGHIAACLQELAYGSHELLTHKASRAIPTNEQSVQNQDYSYFY